MKLLYFFEPLFGFCELFVIIMILRFFILSFNAPILKNASEPMYFENIA